LLRGSPAEAWELKIKAMKWFNIWKAWMLVEEARAVKYMKKGLFNFLHFYDSAPELWESVRKINTLNRAHSKNAPAPPPDE